MIRGCYEMLMVLAEAVAQPLPGESATVQARAGIEILDRAACLLHRPTHAYHLRKAACLEAAGDAEGAKQERRRPSASSRMVRSTTSSPGSRQYKLGHKSQSKRHFAEALQAQPNHFWAQCLLAICDLNTRNGERRKGQGLSDSLPAEPSRAPLALSASRIRIRSDRFEGHRPRKRPRRISAAALADYREALAARFGRPVPLRAAGQSRASPFAKPTSWTRPSPTCKRRSRSTRDS